jgi:hypothetical protein
MSRAHWEAHHGNPADVGSTEPRHIQPGKTVREVPVQLMPAFLADPVIDGADVGSHIEPRPLEVLARYTMS